MDRAGGYALALHLNRSWRTHTDIDVGMARPDVNQAKGWLSDLCLRTFDAGSNNLWASKSDEGPWRLDLTIGEGDSTRWIYRRDSRLRRPWNRAVLTNSVGIPYLAPELQLLFKAKNVRPKMNRTSGKSLLR